MDCILLAAGKGIRMKSKYPKQFMHLCGKPILIYSLEILEQISEIEKVFLLYNQDYMEDYNNIIEQYNISKVEFVEGGATRQESVYNGLIRVKSQHVLIHEASRPFLYKGIINDLLKYADEKAIIPTVPIPFTVSAGANYMEHELDRSKLHNIQLPQLFITNALIEAHRKARLENYLATEDGMLMFKYGNKVRFIDGYENNLKITTPFDMIVAEQIIKGVRFA